MEKVVTAFTGFVRDAFSALIYAALVKHRLKRDRLSEAKQRVQAKLAERKAAKAGRSPYTPEPRYDEVYYKGTEWLDSLARQEFDESRCRSNDRRKRKLSPFWWVHSLFLTIALFFSGLAAHEYSVYDPYASIEAKVAKRRAEAAYGAEILREDMKRRVLAHAKSSERFGDD